MMGVNNTKANNTILILLDADYINMSQVRFHRAAIDEQHKMLCRKNRGCNQTIPIFVQSFVKFAFRLSLAFVRDASESLAAVTITGTRHRSIDKYFLSFDVYRIFVDRDYCLSGDGVTGRMSFTLNIYRSI